MSDSTTQSVARIPRGAVKINGETVSGWECWEVDNNSFYQADTFRVEFAVSALPEAFSPTWWATQKAVQIEIFHGQPVDPDHYTTNELTGLIVGNVDEIEYDPTGTILTITGRDRTALLIDTKTTEKFPNQTASQIAKTLAQRHGLTPVVTATSTQTGRYYEIDHVQLNDERSEWDLLAYLANKEGFVVYVTGNELHFEPPTAEKKKYPLTWEIGTLYGWPRYNGTRLSVSRNLTVAKGVSVVVRSWNQKKKKGFTATYPKAGGGTKAGHASPAVQTYTFVIPNLQQDEADRIAQAKHLEITQHEMKLDAELPADTVLDVRSVIVLDGTGTAWDQTYFPDSVVRRMSAHEYTMRVTAKNHSPDSEVSA